jgi:MFS family permease
LGILDRPHPIGNRVPITALLVANCISLIGSSLTAIAIPWFVLTTTGSASRAGLSGAFSYIPAFTAGILGGAAIDRIGARPSALIADLVSGCAILMIPLLYHTRGLEFWQLLIFVLLGSMLEIPGVSSRRAMLPPLAELGDVRLERVNAILEGNQHIAFFLGPPLAGVLIAFFGASNVLWIDGGTSLLSAATILLLIPNMARAKVQTVASGYISDIRIGLRWLWQDKVVRAISFGLCFGNAFGAPFFSLIFAVYVKDRFDDPRYLGVMLSSYSVGLMIGTFFYGAVGHRVSRRVLMVAFFLSVTLAYWPVVGATPFPLLLACFVLGGLFDGPVNPMLVTVRLERIPLELRGRVFSATSAIAQLMPAVTIPVAGLMIQHFGLRTTVIVIAGIAQVLVIGMAAQPIWKRLDDSTPGRATGSSLTSSPGV